MKITAREYLGSIGRVLKQPRYLLIGMITAVAMVVVAAWLPNLRLVGDTISSSSLHWGEKVGLLAALAASIATNFQPESRAMIIASAILAGIQVALVAYYLGQKVKAGKAAGGGILGIVSSLLGVGCASCGSVILTSILGVGTSGAVLSYLPWHGVEFAAIGLVIILISVVLTAKKLYETQFCKVKSKTISEN